MKRFAVIGSVLGFIFLVPSCILPVPHRRVHLKGHEGQVVRAGDRTPIPGAKVTTPSGDKTLTVTDSNGRFRLGPVYGWHGAYLIGPISYSILPHFDMCLGIRSFRVSAEGYQEWPDPRPPYQPGGSSVIELKPLR